MFNELAAPFDPALVSWRSQTLAGNGTSALALCYIDARDVMNRLDEVIGPAGWQDSYTETVKGRLMCTIKIRCGEEWISKSDGAGDTDVEGDKGAISDAFKRAAVKWGIGRYLYDVEATWADCETYEKSGKRYWKSWTPEGLQKLSRALAKVGKPAVAPGPAATPNLTESDNRMIDDIFKCETPEALDKWLAKNKAAAKASQNRDRLLHAYETHLANLNKTNAAQRAANPLTAG